MLKSMSWMDKFEKKLGKRDIPNIVWDDSSSEEEIFSLNCKRQKTCKQSPIQCLFSDSDINICDRDSCDSSPEVGWNSFHSYQISPEITQKVFEREVSPVIEKRHIRLKRHKQRKAQLKKSSFLFEIGTQHIETCTPNTEQYTQAILKIEHFPSQFCSEVIPSVEICNNLYYQPVKKKKQFNKNSFAYHVHKTLKNKINSIKFWHHEKVNRINCTEVDECNLEVQVININIEYGNVLLECKILSNKKYLEGVFKEVLINVGVKYILNICWERQSIYKLYLPYTMEKIFYNGKYVLYICNISKVMKKNS